MFGDSRTKFDAGAGAWAAYNREPLGQIRQEVTWHNLAAYLPQVTTGGQPRRVLDAGGGSGELAVRLARHGYQVWLVDSAEAMLAQAQQLAQSLPERDRARLTFCPMPVDEAAGAFSAASFDAITCHTLIEYLPRPRNTLGKLAGLLRPGGLLSLSFVNYHAEVLRQVWGQGGSEGALGESPGPAALAGAMDRLDPAAARAFHARLFDLPGRAYTAGQVSAWLADLGLSVTAQLGVRAFADQICQQQGIERLDDPDFFQALLRLEMAAASRSPYKLIARYVHLIAHQAEGTEDD